MNIEKLFIKMVQLSRRKSGPVFKWSNKMAVVAIQKPDIYVWFSNGTLAYTGLYILQRTIFFCLFITFSDYDLYLLLYVPVEKLIEYPLTVVYKKKPASGVETWWFRVHALQQSTCNKRQNTKRKRGVVGIRVCAPFLYLVL
jgi:hypothetical protein